MDSHRETGLISLIENLDAQVKLINLFLEIERKQVEVRLLKFIQFLLIRNNNTLVAFGGNGVDTRFEIITLCPLQ